MVISPTMSMHQIDCNVIVNVSRLQRWLQQLQIHLAPNWSISAQNIRKAGGLLRNPMTIHNGVRQPNPKTQNTNKQNTRNRHKNQSENLLSVGQSGASLCSKDCRHGECSLRVFVSSMLLTCGVVKVHVLGTLRIWVAKSSAMHCRPRWDDDACTWTFFSVLRLSGSRQVVTQCMCWWTN